MYVMKHAMCYICKKKIEKVAQKKISSSNSPKINKGYDRQQMLLFVV